MQTILAIKTRRLLDPVSFISRLGSRLSGQSLESYLRHLTVWIVA
jgi:hypothetical protein